MNKKINILNCDRCGQEHEIEIDFDVLTKEQKDGKQPVVNNFICPDIARMYKVVNFNLDLRVNSIKNDILNQKSKDSALSSLKYEYGELNFEDKLKRFLDLNFAFIGLPEEYYNLLLPIISAYYCGYFYPAMTGAGSLGERILNRLMFKTLHHFKASLYYRKFYNKNSSDNWELLVEALKDWKVISDTVGNLFLDLKTYRNDSIHYNEGYDFEKNTKEAILILIRIINNQFNYIERKDLFWVFDSPGEIFLRSNTISNPFVIEFIIPHCVWISPLDEPTSNPPFKAKDVPLKPLSDEEFIKIRNNRTQ